MKMSNLESAIRAESQDSVLSLPPPQDKRIYVQACVCVQYFLDILRNERYMCVACQKMVEMFEKLVYRCSKA